MGAYPQHRLKLEEQMVCEKKVIPERGTQTWAAEWAIPSFLEGWETGTSISPSEN